LCSTLDTKVACRDDTRIDLRGSYLIILLPLTSTSLLLFPKICRAYGGSRRFRWIGACAPTPMPLLASRSMRGDMDPSLAHHQAITKIR
jgi:hypothetical protein